MPYFVMYNYQLEKVTAAEIADMAMARQVAHVWNERHKEETRQQIFIVIDDDNLVAGLPSQ